MRGWIDKIIKAYDLWSVYALLAKNWAGLLAMAAQIPVANEVWFYVNQAAEIEGWWIYVVFVFYLASLPIAVAVVARAIIRRLRKRTKTPLSVDPEDPAVITIRTDMRRLWRLLSDFGDPVAQQQEVSEIAKRIEKSGHKLWLSAESEQARVDFLHWCRCALAERLRHGPTFRNFDERQVIIDRIQEASDRIDSIIVHGAVYAGPRGTSPSITQVVQSNRQSGGVTAHTLHVGAQKPDGK